MPCPASARAVHHQVAYAVRLIEQRRQDQQRRAIIRAVAEAQFVVAVEPIARNHAALGPREIDEIAEILEQLAIDLVILDQDAQAILHLGEKPCDRHRIELGQRAEQLGIAVETGDLRFGQAQNVAQHLAHHGFDRVARSAGLDLAHISLAGFCGRMRPPRTACTRP